MTVDLARLARLAAEADDVIVPSETVAGLVAAVQAALEVDSGFEDGGGGLYTYPPARTLQALRAALAPFRGDPA